MLTIFTLAIEFTQAWISQLLWARSLQLYHTPYQLRVVQGLSSAALFASKALFSSLGPLISKSALWCSMFIDWHRGGFRAGMRVRVDCHGAA